MSSDFLESPNRSSSPSAKLVRMPADQVALILILSGSGTLSAIGAWVQFVQYPRFLTWSDQEFKARHSSHCFWISIPVIPALIAQLGGTIWLTLSGTSHPITTTTHLLLLLCSTGLTFLITGPIHRRLAARRDEEQIKKLIRSNFPRTIAWFVHAVLSAVLLMTSKV